MLHRFDLWMYRVDDILIRHTGLDSGSFEDWNWKDDFDSGMLPINAAMEFLLEHGLVNVRPSFPSMRGIGPAEDFNNVDADAS